MAANHTIQVTIAADTRKFRTAMGELNQATGFDKLRGAVGKLGTVLAGAAVAAGAAAVGIGAKVVGIAGALQQSAGAVDTVFKNGSGQMHQWAQSAHDSVGLAAGQYNELATIIGTQLKNGGTAMDQLGSKTNNLIGLGADLSSMFGGTTSDAVSALSSALKGERDPIERYGVSLTQAAIDAKAAELGFSKVGGALSTQATQAATLALIMDQTKDAQGNFARENNTWEHQLQVGKATLTDLGGRLGTVLLPALTRGAAIVNRNMVPAFNTLTRVWQQAQPTLQQLGQQLATTVVPALQQLGTFLTTTVVPALQQLGTFLTTQVVPALAAFGGWVQQSTGWLLPLFGAIAAGVLVWRAWVTAIQIWQAVTKVAAAVQAIFNAVMAANPIMLVVILIAALVAAIIIAWKHNETFRRVVTNVWNTIKTAVLSAASSFLGACRNIGAAAGQAWALIRSAFVNAPRQFADWFRGIYQAATGKLSDLVSWVSGLPGRILSALGSLGSLLTQAGADVVQGLINGLAGMLGRLQEKAREIASTVTNAVKNALSIKSPSRVFREIGAFTVAGLVEGIDQAGGRAARAGQQLADTLTSSMAGVQLPEVGAMLDQLDTSTVTLAGGRAQLGGGVTIQAQMLDPSPEVVRRLVELIRDAQRSGRL